MQTVPIVRKYYCTWSLDLALSDFQGCMDPSLHEHVLRLTVGLGGNETSPSLQNQSVSLGVFMILGFSDPFSGLVSQPLQVQVNTLAP